eukprot:TRINITY_DN341_c5_g1_i1.p1 TRINITY_DN341_c5_g1~~TRINITY_DN341_c5_g1_i1.p1  ORF type:complete len:1192 (+),score=403.97 TRINITY_DN341_c5_g1_i1:87-3662(+)
MLGDDDDLWDAEEVAFLRNKEVPNLVSDAVMAMVAEKPDDPRAWLTRYFSQQQQQFEASARKPLAVRLDTGESSQNAQTTEVVSSAFPDGKPRKLSGTAASAVASLAADFAASPVGAGEINERLQGWMYTQTGRRKSSIGRPFRSGMGDFGAREVTRSELRASTAGPPVGPEPEIVVPLAHSREAVRIEGNPLHGTIVLILVNESGKVLYWNYAAEVATGILSASAVGQSIACFMADGSASLLEEIKGATTPIKRTLSDFAVNMPVWHDVRRDGVVTELTEHDMQVRYATGDLHRYRPGSIGQGKIRPMPREENRVPDERHNYEFTRADGVHRVRLLLNVQGGPSAGYAALIGVPQPPGDHRAWMLDQLRAEFRGLLLKTEGTKLHPEIQKTSVLLERGIDVDTSCWAPLRLHALLSRLNSDIDTMATQWGVEVSVIQPGHGVPAEVSTDGAVLSPVLSMLLNNAVRFSGKEDASPQARDSRKYRVTLSCTRVGRLISINVADQGPGLPGEVEEVLKGTCMDMEVGKNLRQAMTRIAEVGGTIESRPGDPPTHDEPRGTVMSVVIPNVPAAATQGHLSPASFSGCPGTPHSLANDDPEHSPCSSIRNRGSPSARGSPAREGRRGSLVPGSNKRAQLRCVVLVPAVVHRMSLVHQLWERSYTLAMAAELPTREELQDCELLIVDVQAPGIDTEILFEFLRDADSKVLLATRYDLNELQKKQIKSRGWFVIRLPVLPIQLGLGLDEIEAKVLSERKQKKENEEIAKAFSKGLKHVPWEKGKQLGRGSFGSVYEAICKMTGGKMAVKVIPMDTGKQDADRERAVLSEVELMAQLDHENILRYFYAERTEAELHIFMEFATDGSLKGRIPSRGMPPDEAAAYLLGVLRGLAYLHAQAIVHRDIKADNVLLNQGTPKLCDFGTAARRGEGKVLADFEVGMAVRHDMRGEGTVVDMDDDRMRVRFSGGEEHGYNVASVAQGKIQPLDEEAGKKTSIAGTPHYMAPEVLAGQPATPAADVWACGCLLMELCTGKPPFAHKGEGWMPMRYVSQLKEGQEIDVGPHSYHPVVREFLLETLKFQPDHRPRCSDLIKGDIAALAIEDVKRIAAAPPSPQPSPRNAQNDDPWASDSEEESVSEGWGVPVEEDQARREEEEERAHADAVIESNLKGCYGDLSSTLPTRRMSMYQRSAHTDPAED